MPWNSCVNLFFFSVAESAGEVRSGSEVSVVDHKSASTAEFLINSESNDLD